jgi:hypothetical protein
MDIFKFLNLALRFVLELCLVAAMGFIGYETFGQSVLRWLAAAVLVAATVAIWGYWIAPKAARQLKQPRRLLVEVVLFGSAAAGLALVGEQKVATEFAVAVACNEVLIMVWKQ